MQIHSKTTSSEHRVLVFPAQTPMLSGRPVHFLFSLRQADDILTDAAVMPVPLSPPYIEGIAEWRGQIMPVISLEACLGLEPLESLAETRLAVVRTPQKHETQVAHYRIMVRMAAPIQMLPLPIECTPVSKGWPADRHLTKGVYEWKNGWLVVAHMENIVQGKLEVAANGERNIDKCKFSRLETRMDLTSYSQETVAAGCRQAVHQDSATERA